MELQDSINAVLRAEEHSSYAGEDFSNKPLNNVNTLINIFSREKTQTPLILSLVLSYPCPKYSYLGFEFLIRIKEFKKAFEYIEKNLNKIRNSSLQYFSEYYSLFNNCMIRLNFLIADESFSIKEIEALRNYVIKTNILLPKKHLKLGNNYFASSEIAKNESLRMEIIKRIDIKKAELIQKNYDQDLLKEDLKFVVDKIKELELGEGIALAFTKLENNYYEAKDKNDFAIFGGYIRGTIMGLVKEMALKISKGKEEVIKEKDEHYRNYLKTSGMINEGLWRMLSALYDFLSCGINHNIEIDREYYRRGLNITSQIAYLLLRDYERFMQRERKIG